MHIWSLFFDAERKKGVFLPHKVSRLRPAGDKIYRIYHCNRRKDAVSYKMLSSENTPIEKKRSAQKEGQLSKIDEDKFEQRLAMSGKMRYNQL